MNILFVIGGSYKAFYLNNLNKIKNVDLIIFQDNILYEYDYYNENFEEKIVSTEMIGLAEKFNCKIIAIVDTNLIGIKQKEILYADSSKVCVFDIKNYLSVYIKNKLVKFAVQNTIHRGDVSIRIDIKNSNSKLNFLNRKTIYFYCDKTSAKIIKNGKIKRKIRKNCYFCLRF